jgi:hypothetical protein
MLEVPTLSRASPPPQGVRRSNAGAAEGCDLLILIFKDQSLPCWMCRRYREQARPHRVYADPMQELPKAAIF